MSDLRTKILEALRDDDEIRSPGRIADLVMGLVDEDRDALQQRLNEADQRIDETERQVGELRDQLETERMRLVACGVVALANTTDSAEQARDMHPDYKSASCSDVAYAVDREIALRTKLDTAMGLLRGCHTGDLHGPDDWDMVNDFLNTTSTEGKDHE